MLVPYIKIRLIPALIILALICCLVSLGFWQLSRYNEKLFLNQALSLALSKKTLLLNSNNISTVEDAKYLNLGIKGKFLSEYQLAYDNQTHNGVAGYKLIVPFVIQNSSKVILVDLGWTPWVKGRRMVDRIELPNDDIYIEGIASSVINRPTFDNKLSIDANVSFPKLIQNIDFQFISKITNLNYIKKVLHLAETFKVDKFIPVWKPYYGKPDKHLAYSVQWFAMAGVLFLISIFLIFRKNNMDKIKK